MNKNCFVIPVNLPKINWLISFLNSIEVHSKSFPFDIIIGASDEEEYRRYARLIPFMSRGPKIYIIDISRYIRETLKSNEIFDRYIHNADGCIVNLKKFILLKWAVDHEYDRIASVDGDTLAIRDMSDVFDAMHKNYQKKILVGSSFHHNDVSHITTQCLRHFDENLQYKLKNSDGHFIYTWFFDAPYMEREDLIEFFDYMNHRYGSLQDWLKIINRDDFEHQIFHYWMYLYKNCTIFDTKYITGHLKPETYLYTHLLSINNIENYCPVWVYAWEFMHQPDIVHGLPNIFMLSHFDRMFL